MEKAADIPVDSIWLARNSDGSVDIQFQDTEGETAREERSLSPKRAIEHVSRFLGIIQ